MNPERVECFLFPTELRRDKIMDCNVVYCEHLKVSKINSICSDGVIKCSLWKENRHGWSGTSHCCSCNTQRDFWGANVLRKNFDGALWLTRSLSILWRTIPINKLSNSFSMPKSILYIIIFLVYSY